MSYWQFPRYVSVSEKRARAEKKIRQLQKKNPDIAPVIIEGRSLAKTWWGKSWNTNLERYADYSNRIERGRSYLRHRAVVDLRINKGAVSALVQGSRSKPYAVKIHIKALVKKKWKTIIGACTGKLDSLQDLLAGRFPKELSHLFMEKGSGLFPTPPEIQFSCSCPDWAYMCKHVAAVLYGIGARLDQDASLFFLLRQVNLDDLISKALEDTTGKWIQKADDNAHPIIAEADLGNVFGIDMEETPEFGKDFPGAAPKPAKAVKRVKQSNPSKHASIKASKAKGVDEKTRILKLVQQAPDGINAPDLHEKSGIDMVKIRNVLYQAYRKGQIRKVARGIYQAKATKPKRASGTERLAAVLAVIKAAPDGIRTPRVAEETGFPTATVRAMITRLLKTGGIRRISHGLYGPPGQTRKKKTASAANVILSMIQSHPDGVGFAALKAQSGYEEKQLRNIVFRLFKSRKVRGAGRGIYIAV
ncbi:MAG: SWIM zinc finger family protein [Desulfosarcina sp.]|nr:SWIM zinc finger family protein [Desulfosarcina sp.]